MYQVCGRRLERLGDRVRVEIYFRGRGANRWCIFARKTYPRPQMRLRLGFWNKKTTNKNKKNEALFFPPRKEENRADQAISTFP